MDAEECKRLSKYVLKYKPINIKPMPDNIGKNVYCGNSAVEEYWRKQEEEHSQRI